MHAADANQIVYYKKQIEKYESIYYLSYFSIDSATGQDSEVLRFEHR